MQIVFVDSALLICTNFSRNKFQTGITFQIHFYQKMCLCWWVVGKWSKIWKSHQTLACAGSGHVSYFVGSGRFGTHHQDGSHVEDRLFVSCMLEDSFCLVDLLVCTWVVAIGHYTVMSCTLGCFHSSPRLKLTFTNIANW